MSAPRAPMGVTILAYLGAFVALACVLLGVAALTVGPAGDAIRAGVPVLGPLTGVWVGVTLLLFGALVALTAWGLLRKRSWAWVLAIVLVALSAAGDLERVARRDANGLAGLLVVGALVWYLFRPEVRAWFNER